MQNKELKNMMLHMKKISKHYIYITLYNYITITITDILK